MPQITHWAADVAWLMIGSWLYTHSYYHDKSAYDPRPLSLSPVPEPCDPWRQNVFQHVLPTIRNGVLQLYGMALHEGMRMITSVAAGQAIFPPMPISPNEPPKGVGPGVCTLGSKCYRTDVPFYVRRYMGHTGDSRSSLVSPSGPFAHTLLYKPYGVH